LSASRGPRMLIIRFLEFGPSASLKVSPEMGCSAFMSVAVAVNWVATDRSPPVS